MPVVLRKPRVQVRADIPVCQLYQAVLQALAAWSDQQADAFAGAAAYALTREELETLARQYVELDILPSA